MKLNDALAYALLECGVDRIFGVSGANIEHFHDAIFRSHKLQSVLAKSETGAAFMADGYARINKRMGVVCATSGGGMTNLVSGIAESYQEGIGVLAIIGQPPQGSHGRGGFQDSSGIGHTINAELLWQSVAKYVGALEKSEQFWPVLIEAIRSCYEKRPGPSVLLIPRDLFDQEVGSAPSNLLEMIKINYHNINQALLQQVLDEIRRAQSPVLIFGLGIKLSRWQDEAIELAHALNLPVFTTLSSKCAFPNDDPQYFGTLGVAGHPSAHDFINSQTDLILSLGTTQPLMMRGPIESGLIKNTIAVDVDIEAIERVLPLKFGIASEPGWFSKQLFALVKQTHITRTSLPAYQRTLVKPTVIGINDSLKPKNLSLKDCLRQSEAIALISEYLPARSHLFFDAGNCAAAALHYLDIPHQGTATIALGMGGMGYAVGAAIGAQISAPHKQYSCVFIGDGAFLMSGLETHTAFQYRLPVLFIVFNNHRHGMCVTRQKIYFSGRSEATMYNDIDISAIVSGLSQKNECFIAQVSTAQELSKALKSYQAHPERPSLIELRLALEELPPFTPFASARPEVIPLIGSMKESILSAIAADRAREIKNE